MTTRYKAASGGILDAFNYYHSQLRINAECAFGILIHRWGCLHTGIPAKLALDKSFTRIKYLCILLHNFLLKHIFLGN